MHAYIGRTVSERKNDLHNIYVLVFFYIYIYIYIYTHAVKIVILNNLGWWSTCPLDSHHIIMVLLNIDGSGWWSGCPLTLHVDLQHTLTRLIRRVEWVWTLDLNLNMVVFRNVTSGNSWKVDKWKKKNEFHLFLVNYAVLMVQSVQAPFIVGNIILRFNAWIFLLRINLQVCWFFLGKTSISVDKFISFGSQMLISGDSHCLSPFHI